MSTLEPLVGHSLMVDAPGKGVTLDVTSALQLHCLDVDGATGEGRVVAAVVHVEVGVRDELNITTMDAGASERVVQVAVRRLVVSIHPRVASDHSGVEEQDPVRVIDDVAQDRLDARTARRDLLARADEPPEVNRADI